MTLFCLWWWRMLLLLTPRWVSDDGRRYWPLPWCFELGDDDALSLGPSMLFIHRGSWVGTFMGRITLCRKAEIFVTYGAVLSTELAVPNGAKHRGGTLAVQHSCTIKW